jgi:glyceraldehyde 3-phosphate dehydrogenase
MELIAVNDIADIENIAYLLRYDTVYGRYDREVRVEDGNLVIDGQRIPYLSERDPANLPWGDMNVDIVIESTGFFTRQEDAGKHIQAGARAVVISAPSKSEDVPTVVHGVNTSSGDKMILSCASCTTNNIAPVVEIMDRHFGVAKAIMTTIHAYTSSQQIVDGPAKKDFRRGRAGAENLVPTSTGAAIATTKALPELENRFDGIAVRVPIPVGSISDMVFVTERDVTVEEVNAVFEQEAGTDRYNGILGITNEPLVSSDIVMDPRASIVDLSMTKVVDGNLVKVLSWYDNEWGYTNQMIREARKLAQNMRVTT